MKHISQIFLRTGRISGPEVEDGTKPDVPTTDRQNEKKTNFQKFLSDDGNESLLSSSPSLTGINIQASVMKIVKVGKAPNENRPGSAPLRNVADLVYSNKLKQNRKNIHENITFTLATDEKSSRKIANPNMIR